MFFHIDQQKLIYIKGKREVEKSRIVKAIKIRFTLLGKKKKLIICAPTSSAANDVDGNIVHTT